MRLVAVERSVPFKHNSCLYLTLLINVYANTHLRTSLIDIDTDVCLGVIGHWSYWDICH